MSRKTRVVISDREDELLFFLWRHRVATFQTLRHIFFPSTGTETTYNRLRKLRAHDFVRVEYTEKHGKSVWCLGDRGFRYLESVRLSDLKSSSYRTKSRLHDLLVMSALLGDWYKRCPEEISIVTDQELLTMEPVSIPAKLLGKFTHRPDGLWIKTSGREASAIALEVELHPKSNARMEEICSFYSGFHFIENVIWILPDKSLAKKIQGIALASAMPRAGQHLFVLVDEFKSKLWASKFVNASMQGKTMSDFLNQNLETPFRSPIETPIKTHPNQGSLTPQQLITSPLLNSAISLERLKAYAKHGQRPNP